MSTAFELAAVALGVLCALALLFAFALALDVFYAAWLLLWHLGLAPWPRQV